MADNAETPRATVLVVDDNDANRSLARHTLEDEGYRVLEASAGEEALAIVEREAPDCILLDVRMPGMDGFAVCERIRALPRGAETPVVFLTALRDVETFDHALRAGGDDFLTKPVRPTELVIRVQSALKLRRLSARAPRALRSAQASARRHGPPAAPEGAAHGVRRARPQEPGQRDGPARAAPRSRSHAERERARIGGPDP